MRPLLPATLVGVACGAPSPVEAPPAPGFGAAAAPPSAPGAARAEPRELPPVVAGALRIGRLDVQICAPDACPLLLQPAGASHCAGRSLGGGGWRLPTLQEAESFAGQDALAQLQGFHWTADPFADDGSQTWIFDPVGGQKTTLPRDRKALRVRCVADAARK